MPIQAIVDKLEDVPEKYRDLYAAGDGGKFKLVGVEGVRTQEDIDRVMGAHNNEKTSHKLTKTELQAYRDKGINAKKEADGSYTLTYQDKPLDAVFGELDQIPTLKAAAEKAGNTPEKLQELVRPLLEKELGKVKGPLERSLRDVTDKATKLETENLGLKTQINNRTIGDEIQKAATALKMRPEALEHIVRAGVGVFEVGDDGKVATKDGVDVLTYLTAKKRDTAWSIFWPDGQGAGGGPGGKGGTGDKDNPWSATGWNLTQQGRILTTDPQGADTLAKMAGHAGAVGAKRQPVPKK